MVLKSEEEVEESASSADLGTQFMSMAGRATGAERSLTKPVGEGGIRDWR